MKKISKLTKHYIEEAVVFSSLIIAVMMADAVHKFVKGKIIGWHDIIANVPSFLVVVFIAIIVYGSMYSRPYKGAPKTLKLKKLDETETEQKEVTETDSAMAPLQKRIMNAITHGFMWRLMLGD